MDASNEIILLVRMQLVELLYLFECHYYSYTTLLLMSNSSPLNLEGFVKTNLLGLFMKNLIKENVYQIEKLHHMAVTHIYQKVITICAVL